MYRHGDIMLRPCADIPTSSRLEISEPGERLVLATGEATGHAHVLYGLATAATEARPYNVTRSLVHLLEPGELRHEEHKTINVPPGWYEVVRQRVYTPSSPRWVED
jgi:hypothetical protein